MTALEKLRELYQRKASAGLISVQFAVSKLGEATTEDVAAEILRMEEAIERGDSKPLDFGDLHWREVPKQPSTR